MIIYDDFLRSTSTRRVWPRTKIAP